MKRYIIPVFIPHYGCTHQCIFCNQRKITGLDRPVSPEQVSAAIAEHLAMITAPRLIEVAFYGGSFTALPADIQQALLAPAYAALQQGKIQAIRVSTRPDCINAEIVTAVCRYGVTTIELGVQSLDDDVLRTAGRGHTARQVAAAVAVIRGMGVKCGIQLMPGLPGETMLSLIATACRTVKLKPDFVRIYPAVVIAGTQLAVLYSRGLYRPLTLPQAVRQAGYLKLLFERNGIKVIRTGLQATAELADQQVVLAGPYHPSFGEMADSFIFHLMVSRCLEQLDCTDSEIFICHHSRDTSKIRGLKNANLNRWRQEYSLRAITLAVDDELPLNAIAMIHQTNRYFINKSMLTSL
ncbi:Radical_SAM C-terminal domain-containing protein [Dendrosporobacter quercicolus]|uniref:Radical_SAM C-terminal domain-containing protein n=1 Tax=Dendrosporobacter quercicolus TaxID=146817 RepID=A0A1G9LA12_9FIRM|nr:radical SAM protein [Dendrosporobacter quercicolus]SDL58395.1 Radical_SAM C-terminal domain-containing protein [Dendrosporobacter quercicolus]